MYLLKLALRPWRQGRGAWLGQSFSAIAVGVLLFSMGFVVWIERALDPVIHRLENEHVVTAYLKPEVTSEDEDRISDTIRVTAGAFAERGVQSQKVGPETFLKQLRSIYPELTLELEGLGEEAISVIPRYVSLHGTFSHENLLGLIAKLRSNSAIESVESSEERAHPMVGGFEAIRWVARSLAVGMALALITGLIHMARTNRALHQDAISLMRLWGAGAAMLRIPTVLSGLSIGILGGITAGFFLYFSGEELAIQLRSLSQAFQGLSAPGVRFAVIVGCLGPLSGALSGWFAGGHAGATR